MRRLTWFLILLLIAIPLCGLSGCAQEPPEPSIVPTLPPTPTPTPTPTPEPTPEPTPDPARIHAEKLAQYADWIQQNDDFCGWLAIPNTVIDYPVVYGPDYEYYVKHDFDQKTSQKGAVFTDYRNLPDDPGQNIILFAHHMKDGSMFGSLKKFNDLSFVQENPVFTYDTLHGMRYYQIFAVLIVPVDYNYIQIDFDTPDEFLSFADRMRSVSLYTTDLALSGDDEIISLSTCWYDFKDARFVVQAVRLPDGVEEIPAVYETNADRKRDW